MNAGGSGIGKDKRLGFDRGFVNLRPLLLKKAEVCEHGLEFSPEGAVLNACEKRILAGNRSVSSIL